MLHPLLSGPGCRPLAPVAEGGPVGLSDGGTDGTGSPGVRGIRIASDRTEIVIFFTVFILI